MNKGKVVHKTDIPGLEFHSRGKVRDIWLLPNDKLLIVTTDRISAFDSVVGVIPGKGKTLTRMSKFWFNSLKSIGRHHFIGTDLTDYSALTPDIITANDLLGRCMIVKKADYVVPIECIVRGHLAGSGWKEYQKTGMVCGNALPSGLKQGDKLPEPIFTPSTKAGAGMHDENITHEEMVTILETWLPKNNNVGCASNRQLNDAAGLALGLKIRSLNVYEEARDYAAKKGIIIADTKFEFGIIDGALTLIDEVLTPDSSRFWPAEKWKPGQTQESFDKQYLRDWLTLTARWNKNSPPPDLPEDVIQMTEQKYRDAMQRLVYS